MQTQAALCPSLEAVIEYGRVNVFLSLPQLSPKLSLRDKGCYTKAGGEGCLHLHPPPSHVPPLQAWGLGTGRRGGGKLNHGRQTWFQALLI